MTLSLPTLPRSVPAISTRPTQAGVPPTRALRERIRTACEARVERLHPALPLSFEELRRHADELIQSHHWEAAYRDYVAVVFNAEANRDALAKVPYERRLLLLPKCLRVEDRCPAPFDEFGLLCKQCGLCTIQDLQNEAERLGYAVLTAEGSALVMAILQTGKIDAVVGVSCLSVLEKAFPYMETAAIPGVAVPLLQDDCKDTAVDVEWVWDFIHLTSEDRAYRLDLDAVRQEVESWFTPESMETIAGPAPSKTEQIARDWLRAGGKRWRPFLLVSAWKALQDDPFAAYPDDLKKLAIAVECFHKASLAHDDIEDDDDARYGEPTLHIQHGVPIALNVGDFLLGEGYRLIAETDAPATVRSLMLKIAAEGHRSLCLGQGAELVKSAEEAPFTPNETLAIHAKKTAPAFEVALRLGACYAGAEAELHPILTSFCESLGIAYQIRDDLEDLEGMKETAGKSDLGSQRPSYPFALAFERATGEDQRKLLNLWRGNDTENLLPLIESLGGIERARRMHESYKEQAIRTLADIELSTLKGMLRRIVGKIFRVEIEDWCAEYERAKNV